MIDADQVERAKKAWEDAVADVDKIADVFPPSVSAALAVADQAHHDYLIVRQVYRQAQRDNN